MTARASSATLHERRLTRRLEGRGDKGLAEALLGLKGVVVERRFEFLTLYAVGGEGAVYIMRDLDDPSAPHRVGKVPLLPLHEPFKLSANRLRRQRDELREEARYLGASSSPFMPLGFGRFEFENPLLDKARGAAFGESEPVLVMEKLPGHDLDRWLARMHRTALPKATMRRTLDRVAVVLLQALVDLYDRGFLYADLRPGNLRMMGHTDRRVRLLDAGSLVALHDRSGRFPHVPAYLPPETFVRLAEGKRIAPSAEIQAVMAGRTLFEVATGQVPRPGVPANEHLIRDANVSPPVADVIEGLCHGDFLHVRTALRYLTRRATRRVVDGNVSAGSLPPPPRSPARAAPKPARSRARSVNGSPFTPVWRRVLAWLRGR